MRVLWVSVEMPDRDGQGGQRRQYHQIKALIALGHTITVLSPMANAAPSSLSATASLLRPRLHIRGRRVPLALARTHRLVSDPRWDAIILSHPESAWLLPAAVRAPVLLDMHNVMSFWHRAAGRIEESRRFELLEAAAISRSDAMMTCSDAETERIGSMHPETDITTFTAPLGIDPSEWPSQRYSRDRARVALFGGWGWEPNRRGLEWFRSEVWPAIKLRSPDAEGLVAGTGVADTRDWPGGLRFVGRVDDLAAFTADAAVVAVPVVEGVGAALKFGEALATGSAVIATPDAASALPSSGAYTSADAVEWADWIHQRLESRRTEPAPSPLRARALAEFTWASAVAPIDDWLRVTGAT